MGLSGTTLSSGPFAHSPNKAGEWHGLKEHLESVAEMARGFAQPFGAGDWGYLAGLWHDLGKFSREFQDYLGQVSSEDHHLVELRGKVDHTTAGAKHAVENIDILGHLLAYVVAGHHAGLLDAVSDRACLDKRLSKEVPPWRHGLAHLPSIEAPRLPGFLQQALSKDPREAAFSFSFFVRMIFSCLVDADFLDTEQFLDRDAALARPRWPSNVLERMAGCLDDFVGQKFAGDDSFVSRKRAEVRNACLTAAAEKPGLFSLTVPTGGGKTLASLAFALRHATLHGHSRVVYVAPFTSIIEQNVRVFREVVAPLQEQGLPDPVIEHHCTLDPREETATNRLAAENWDAPLIVTTTVQFYESLFSNRPSRCRKLHNLARSVIILDEVQKLPVEYLRPCLMALQELAANYGATIVLCTATQPVLHRRLDFPIGLESIREIVPEPRELSLALKRVHVEDLGTLSDEAIAERLASHPRVLCIVNTRKHARELFRGCRDLEGIRHLSAAMCPAHRTETLQKIRNDLNRGQACRVISTQVVEAGVDLDFPVVYRSLAGLDSIAQAAGRCNRNGREPCGTTYVFRSVHVESEAFLRDTANAAAQLLGGEGSPPLYTDLLSLEAVEHYFRLYFWSQRDRWDKHAILDQVKLQSHDRAMPFLLGFETIAERFRLIREEGEPILIPWGDQGHELCCLLQTMGELIPVSVMRALQRYVVQVPRRVWAGALARGAVRTAGGWYAVLPCLDPYYSSEVGLDLGVETFEPEALMV